MEILLTAPIAKTAALKAASPQGAVEGGEGDFDACLQEAQSALANPEEITPEGTAPTEEGVTAPEAVPAPSFAILPDASRSLAPALAAQIQNSVPPPPPPSVTPAIAPTPAPIEVPPAAGPTAAPKAMGMALPEAPADTEISVQVVDFEPFTPPAAEVAETLPAVTAESAPTDDEEAPEPDSDLPPSPESPKIEVKGEAKTEAALRTEGPSKAETVKPETRLDTHNVVRELANRIELMAAAKSPQGVLVHLEPADLGSITLLVKPESGGAVSADIGASNDQVRQALQGSQQTLQRQLELRGVAVANVTVSAQTADRDPQQHGQQQAYHPRQFHHQPSTYSAPSYGSPDPVARPSRLKASGVDLWI
jgi:hypothetical protein